MEESGSSFVEYSNDAPSKQRTASQLTKHENDISMKQISQEEIQKSKSQANTSSNQIVEEVEQLHSQKSQNSAQIIKDDTPVRVELPEAPKEPRKKKIRNVESSEEGSEASFQMPEEQQNQFVPQNENLYNKRRLMTAPDNGVRRRYGGFDGGIHQCFVESDLMKAANIYQQFDKKGNLYENRLYSKTSINQAKLNKEQGVYEKKMASHADEMCRINNGSNFSAQMEMGERSYHSKGFAGSINEKGSSVYSALKNGSNQSQSMANIKYGQKAATAMNFHQSPTSTDNGEQFKHLSGGTVRGGSFSKAHGPKTFKSMSLTSKGSFFQRVTNENKMNNMDANLSEKNKKLSNQAFSNFKTSITKLQNIEQNNIHWSLRDYDPKYISNGVGGKQNIFRQAQNLYTNDPSLYGEKNYNKTDRELKKPQEMLNTFYQYRQQDKKVEDLNLTDRQKTYNVGTFINRDCKTIYSHGLENKGKSHIAFTERDHQEAFIQASNKIQKKAYRANTQSRQVDGLYNETKFVQRPSYLNYTRVDFNLLRPLAPKLPQDPKAVVDSMKAGKCHQVYGISDFNQNNRLSGLKYHEKFQQAYGNDQKMFMRKNGEFTQYQDSLKKCQF